MVKREDDYMALIKCPECNNDISDQAEKCPKCGYELKKTEEPPKDTKKFKGKIDYKYIILGLLVVVVGFYMLNQRNNTQTGTSSIDSGSPAPSSGTQPSGGSSTPAATPGTNQGYVVYNDTNLGVQYEIPGSYGTFTDNNGLTYVGASIDSEGALIPYIVLGWSNSHNNPVQFLNAFTDELRKTYNDVAITIDLVQGKLGQYSVYGIQYTYNSSGHLVVDNRYATVINNKIFMIGSKEENVNQEYINDIIRVMFNTLKGGN